MVSLSFNLGGAPDSGESDENLYDVAIIGGGPAGATAALYAARADLKTIVLDRSVTAGALAITSKIANYPGIPEEMTGAELLNRMRGQAEGFGAKFVQSQVMGSELNKDPKELITATGPIKAKTVIIATGKMGRKNKAPGEDEFLGRGVSYCATCDAAFFRNKAVAVFGGSEFAIEEAIFTTQFASEVLLFVPGEKFTASDESVETALANPKLKVHYRRPLKAILGEKLVTGVSVGGPGGEESFPVSGVFIFLPGNAPILDFVQDKLMRTDQGCVMTGSDRMTNIPGVFAVGDLLCSFIQQAVVAASDGAIAGMAAEKYIRGRKKVRSDWG